MARPKGSKNRPKECIYLPPGGVLREGVIPETKIIDVEKSKRCVHSSEHHDPEKKWCNSCGCLKFNECGQ